MHQPIGSSTDHALNRTHGCGRTHATVDRAGYGGNGDGEDARHRLLMVWTDVDAEFEADFNRWYDAEQIPRLLQVPGLSAGALFGGEGRPEIPRDLRTRGPQFLAQLGLSRHAQISAFGSTSILGESACEWLIVFTLPSL
jgi:hypothetical protein